MSAWVAIDVCILLAIWACLSVARWRLLGEAELVKRQRRRQLRELEVSFDKAQSEGKQTMAKLQGWRIKSRRLRERQNA